MKKTSFVIVFLFLIVYTNAQSHDIVWQNSYGGSLHDGVDAACLTADSGYVFAGDALSNDGDVSGNHGDWDYWVIKLDMAGNLLWQKCLGGSDSDRLYGINSTSDGGFIAIGSTNSNNGNVSGNHSLIYSDGWLVKLDSFGNIQWQKCLGGTDVDAMKYVEETFDGGYITGGKSYSNDGDVTLNQGQSDCWVVKLDDLGNIQWQKSYGGSGIDDVYKIIQLADSSYIFTGTSSSDDGDVSNGLGGDDVWVVKLDTNGDIEWEKSYGGSGGDHSACIVQSENGGYTISAMTYSTDGNVSGNHGYFDIWLIEIDSLGNLIWQKCYGGSDYENSKWMNKTADGGNIVVGETLSNDGDVTGNHGDDCWVIKTDNTGNLEWQQCYGGSNAEAGRSIFLNPAGNHIIASWSSSDDGDVTSNHGELDFWVLEIESNTALPLGAVGSISGQDSICAGTLSETYSIDPIENATSYTWTLDPDISDSIVTNDTVATIYFAQGTSAYTTLSVFGSNIGGNSDTAYFIINIIAQATSSAGSDTTICENSTIMLNGSATSYDHIYWNTLGDGNFDDPFLLNATYAPGSQDISNGNVGLFLSATSIFPCNEIVNDSILISIIGIPQEVDRPVGPQIILLDTCTTSDYHTYVVTSASSYQWILEPSEAGTIIGNGIDATVNWNTDYNGFLAHISVLASNICGSTHSDSLEVNIGYAGISQQSNAFDIRISPNPSQGIFNISFNTNRGNVDLYVNGIDGRAVMHKSLLISDNSSNFTLNLRNEPSGIYYLTIVFDHTEIMGYKLIKQ